MIFISLFLAIETLHKKDKSCKRKVLHENEGLKFGFVRFYDFLSLLLFD